MADPDTHSVVTLLVSNQINQNTSISHFISGETKCVLPIGIFLVRKRSFDLLTSMKGKSWSQMIPKTWGIAMVTWAYQKSAVFLPTISLCTRSPVCLRHSPQQGPLVLRRACALQGLTYGLLVTAFLPVVVNEAPLCLPPPIVQHHCGPQWELAWDWHACGNVEPSFRLS